MLAWTRTAVALLAFWFLGLGAAQGAWRAVEGIDAASGKPSLLLIGELDARTGLYARCVDGHAEMYLDGFDGGDFEIAPVGPVNLIITSDAGKSWSSEARYGREKSGYVTTTWLTRETISAAVAELVAAKSAISISIEFAETGDVSVWETDATGSTAAGKRFLEACPQTQFSGLPEPVAPPPAAQPATQPADAGSVALPEMTLELDESGPVLRLKGRLDDKHVLTFNCDGNGSIVVIANDGQESAPSPDRAFRLSIGINGGAPWVGTAKLARLAPGYMGYYSVPEGSGMWKLLVAVMEASGRFEIGLEDAATGEVLRWSKTPIGFGTPVYQYYTQCLLSTFSEPPASAPEAEPTWQTIITTSAEAMLVGALEPNARLVATCDIEKNVTLSLVAADLPYQTGDVGLNLYLEIDGEDRSSTGEAFDASDGLKGVAYTGDYVAAAIQAIATARTGIKLKVQNYADGSLVEWSAPDLEGLAGATESFNANCFGTAPGRAAAENPAPTPRIQNPAAADPDVDWTTAQGDQVTLPDVRAVLMGRASPASGILQMTCGIDRQMWSVGLTATDPSTIAIRESDAPFSIGLIVDDTTFTFPNAQYLASSSGVSIIADAGTDLAGALIMLTLSFNPVTLTVTGASGEVHTYTVGIFGMAEASGELSRACLG